ncbi:MAG: hypothetical protein JW751_22620 [Polyangiaceae bacterium]|nr:hypothetical protein [Polyangiaceae bacterium]
MNSDEDAPLDWDPDETTSVLKLLSRASSADSVSPTTHAILAPVSEPTEEDDLLIANMRRRLPPPVWLAVLGALVLGIGGGYLLFSRGSSSPGPAVAAATNRGFGVAGANEAGVKVRSRGALAPEVVEKGVREVAGSLVQRCWLMARATRAGNAPDTAEVVMNLDVRDTGGVQSIEIVEQPPGYHSLASCVRTEAMRWMFPVAAGETVARVAVRFGGTSAE